jgi:hypothetical protein
MLIQREKNRSICVIFSPPLSMPKVFTQKICVPLVRSVGFSSVLETLH